MKRNLNCVVRVFILVFCCFKIDPFYAQSNSIDIQGNVIDAETGEPIEFATVYLSYTTCGALTGKNGEYKIKNCPTGKYKIICSAVGYSINSKTVKLVANENLRIDFRVKVNPIKVAEIKVVGKDPVDWKASLQKFKKEFIGTSKASFECELINPEVLDFTIEKKNLIAAASSSLILINRWLGYKLTVTLKEFSWDRNFSEGKYAIEPFFEELVSKDSSEINRWKENRLEEYKGSFRHFLKSCANHNLFNEGFAITITDTSTLKDISGSILDNEKNIIRRAKFKSDSRLFSSTKKTVDSALSKILFTKKNADFMLVYPSFIKVRYFNESEEFNYKFYKEQMFYTNKLEGSQVTWLKFPSGKYSFNANGIGTEEEYFQKQFLGYWAWKRVCDLLPNDYEPPIIKNE